MKKRSLIFFLMLALLSGSAWAQSEYHSYTNINHTYGSSSSLSTYNSDRYPERLFDNSLDTKYCVVFTGNTWAGYLSVTFESNDLIIPSKYVIYTGDDTQSNPGRNPKSWHIDAKVNESDSWTTIHTVTNANLPTTNKTRVEYTLSGVNTAYKYFRFYINSVESGSIFQLQDFHFIATVQGEGFVLNQNLNEDLTCGGTTYKFYDSGGASGNYSNSENYTAIFNCNSNITITFTSFAVESYSSNYDYLTLYDGETQIAKLGGSSSTISSDITTATSYTATSGTLKAVWHSDGSTVKAGWNATITTGTCRYITEIYTPADWNAFCAAVNSGHDYSGETVTLMNDITTAVTTMAGTITGETLGNAFKGTFDGQGHTLTLNISGGASSGWSFTAPFRCIDGATIKDLKTTGTVTQTGGKGAAGLVGCSTGTCTITNCDVNVTINSQTDGDGTHGGFISYIKSGTTTFNGCAFTGSITGSSTRYCGGFVGWKAGSATFNNCVFAPTEISFNANYSGDNSANFSRNGGTFNNCYYTQTCGSVVQGKLMHSITGASGITVANAGTATSYTPETSTIVGYGTGIKFNNILYAGSGDNVSLTLSGSNNYMADHGTLTGSGSSYTLQMADYDTYIFVPITVSVSANPSNGGTVSGGGQFANGASATVSAMTTGTYCFVNWTENGTVVSTDLNYTFNVTGDCNLVANFVSFDANITVSGNTTIACGSTTTLTASGLNGVAYNWYSDAACTQLVQENSATLTTPALTENTTYYVKAVGGTSSMEQETTFSYTGSAQTYNVPANATKLELEVWGAQGGYRSSSTYGGKGGYSIGTLSDLNGVQNLYVYVGGSGNTGRTSGGYNGGGSRDTYNGGGGATHIATRSGLLSSLSSYQNDVLVVAGGGGSDGATSKNGMYGGGETGGSATQSYGSGGQGGTQTAGGTGSSSNTNTQGSFGQGGKGFNANSGYAGAGGGGWYGGAGSYPDGSGDDDRGGGGGSGHVNAILTDAQTIAGNASMPNPNGGTMTGREGDGYARITAYVTEECESVAVEVTVTVTPLTKTIAAYSNSQTEKGGYYLIASPLAAATAPTDVDGMITDNLGNTATTSNSTYDLYSFDQAAALEWQNYRASNFNLVNGTGYLYASKEGTTLTFSGAPYSGTTKTVTLRKTAAATGLEFPDWNLVGNPFALDDAYITKSFYTLENSDTYTLNTAGTAIHPMQGLLVIADEDGETMTFSTEAPAINNSKLNMNVSNERSVVDQAIISFTEGQELPKLQFRNGSTKVYLPKDGKEYAIVSTEAMGTMPVNFKAENDGTYTLSFTAEEVSFSYLHLIDNLTGEDVDLLAGASTGSATYTFEAKTTDYESRFKLVFATGNNANDEAFAFYSNGSFVINNEGNATLQVIDVNGRILKSESINGCANVNVKAAAGVYVLRLVNGNDVKVQKVVVR